MKFARYGDMTKNPMLHELLEEQKADQMLFAHAEDSGCESCYVEVAKWSEARERWERYCFCKCLDYRLPDMPDASDEETAIEAARRINALTWPEGRANIVHRMPNYTDEPVTA